MYSFPPDADQRIEQLNGVGAAGVAWATGGNTDLAKAPGMPASQAQVMAATSSSIAALLPAWTSGGAYSQFQQGHDLPVVVLGSAVTWQLGIAQAGVTVLLSGVPYLVTGNRGSCGSARRSLSRLESRPHRPHRGPAPIGMAMPRPEWTGHRALLA